MPENHRFFSFMQATILFSLFIGIISGIALKYEIFLKTKGAS